MDEIKLDYAPRRKIISQITKVNGEPEMTPCESAFLCGLIKQFNPQKIVEIGIASGASTAIILQCLNDLGGKHSLFSFDIAEEFYRDKKRKVAFWELKRIK